jgi:hypothetical protein
MKLYPELNPVLSGIDDKGQLAKDVTDKEDPLSIALSLPALKEMIDFISFSSHLVKLKGNGFKWPTASSSLESIENAFNWFLDNAEVNDEAKKIIEELDMPNGVEGSHESLLTEEQLEDPELSRSDLIG